MPICNTSFKLFSGRCLEPLLRCCLLQMCGSLLEPQYLSRYRDYRLRTGRPCCWDSMLGKGTIFIFPKSDEKYWSPHTLLLNGCWTSSPNFKQSGNKSHHSHPSAADVKNAWSCTFTPLYAFITLYVINHKKGRYYFYSCESIGVSIGVCVCVCMPVCMYVLM